MEHLAVSQSYLTFSGGPSSSETALQCHSRHCHALCMELCGEYSLPVQVP